jgi:hypothetical protein
VRGYPVGSQARRPGARGSVEARVPLALVERGYRLVPAFLDRVWGTGFVDAGAAWCSDECPFGAPPGRFGRWFRRGRSWAPTSRFFFHGELALAGGVAVPLTPPAAGVARPRPGVYLRVGRGF